MKLEATEEGNAYYVEDGKVVYHFINGEIETIDFGSKKEEEEAEKKEEE